MRLFKNCGQRKVKSVQYSCPVIIKVCFSKSVQSPRHIRERGHQTHIACETAMAEKITYEGAAPSKEMKDGNGKVAFMFMGKLAGQSKTVHRLVIPSGWDWLSTLFQCFAMVAIIKTKAAHPLHSSVCIAVCLYICLYALCALG